MACLSVSLDINNACEFFCTFKEISMEEQMMIMDFIKNNLELEIYNYDIFDEDLCGISAKAEKPLKVMYSKILRFIIWLFLKFNYITVTEYISYNCFNWKLKQ